MFNNQFIVWGTTYFRNSPYRCFKCIEYSIKIKIQNVHELAELSVINYYNLIMLHWNDDCDTTSCNIIIINNWIIIPITHIIYRPQYNIILYSLVTINGAFDFFFEHYQYSMKRLPKMIKKVQF